MISASAMKRRAMSSTTLESALGRFTHVRTSVAQKQKVLLNAYTEHSIASWTYSRRRKDVSGSLVIQRIEPFPEIVQDSTVMKARL